MSGFPEHSVPNLNAQHYVKHTELMEDLERTIKRLHSPNPSHVALLYGLPGPGKPQVARSFPVRRIMYAEPIEYSQRPTYHDCPSYTATIR